MTGLHGKRKSVQSKTKLAAEVPPARRIKRESSTARPASGDSNVISYVLRNRLVVVPNTSKYIVPCTSSNAHETTQKEPKYAPSRQTPTCAQMGLEHYNSINQGDEHELVKAVGSNAFVFNGVWMHANFPAKRKGGTSCDDLVPKYFFAELKTTYEGFSCVSCVKMDDPGVDRKLGGCGVCPRQIMHPVDGGYRNAQSFNDKSSGAAKRCDFSF